MKNMFLPKKKLSHKILCYIALIAILLSGYFYYQNKTIKILPEMSQSPIQLLMDGPAEEYILANTKYLVKPIGEISLWGIITSLDSKESIYSHNVISVCLLWGNNLPLYIKKAYSSWHENGRCMMKVNPENRNIFDITAFSNNHVLLPKKSQQDIASELEVGQQIKIVGKLVNLKKLDSSTWLESSIIRNDVGDGACEIILPESINILA